MTEYQDLNDMMTREAGPEGSLVTHIYWRRPTVDGIRGYDYSMPIVTIIEDPKELLTTLVERHKQHILAFMEAHPVPTWEKEPVVKQTIKVPPRGE